MQRFSNVFKSSIISRTVIKSAGLKHSSLDGIVYRKMVTSDEAQLRPFLYENYFPRCTEGRLLQINIPDECRTIVDMGFPAAVEEGLSVVAEDIKSESLVGTVTASLVDVQQILSGSEVSLSLLLSEKEKIFIDFNENYLNELYKLEAQKWFLRNKVERFVRMDIAAVHKEMEGRGIGKKLIAEVARIAMESNVNCLTGETANPFSQKALKSLGFDIVSRMPVSEYRYKGVQLFKSDDCYQLWAKVFCKDVISKD